MEEKLYKLKIYILGSRIELECDKKMVDYICESFGKRTVLNQIKIDGHLINPSHISYIKLTDMNGNLLEWTGDLKDE